MATVRPEDFLSLTFEKDAFWRKKITHTSPIVHMSVTQQQDESSHAVASDSVHDYMVLMNIQPDALNSKK